MARWYGTALTTGATVDDVRRWPDRIRAVTAERGAGRRPPLARQAALGHRLSGQGREPAGGEEVMTRFSTAAALRRARAACACARRLGDDDRKDRQPVRHRGLAGARAYRAAGRAQFRLPRRLHPGRGGQGRAPPVSPPTCSTRAPATSTARPSTSGWRTMPSSSASSVGARLFPRLAAHAQRTPRRGLRSAAPCAQRAALRRRRGRARARADAVGVAPRQHQPQQSRQPPLVADGLPRPSLRPREPGHARERAAHHRRRLARLCAPRLRAQ